mgnify:CR=1 FL=1
MPINSLDFSIFRKCKKRCWENFPESARRHRRALFWQRPAAAAAFSAAAVCFLSLSRSVGFVHYPRSVKSSSSSSSTRSFSYFSSVSLTLTLFPFTSSARPDQLSSFFWRSFDTRNRPHQKFSKVQGFQPPPHLTGKLTSARSFSSASAVSELAAYQHRRQHAFRCVVLPSILFCSLPCLCFLEVLQVKPLLYPRSDSKHRLLSDTVAAAHRVFAHHHRQRRRCRIFFFCCTVVAVATTVAATATTTAQCRRKAHTFRASESCFRHRIVFHKLGFARYLTGCCCYCFRNPFIFFVF